jgi:acyl-CoA thioesterase-1
MSNPTARTWLQYTHLDKLYGYLPGMIDALPSIFGLDRAEYDELTADFDTQARQAAQQLYADESFAAHLDALPFRPGQAVLAVGDSITDDLQSWAEILRHLLDLRRPNDGIRVVNGGLSAHTTAMVLRRWPATLRATNPDWIVCALGGNDVTRVGPEPNKPQVSLTESVANLRELRRVADPTGAAWVWITPAPVDEARVAQFPAFEMGESTWRNADVEALAEAIRNFDDPVIDLAAVFGTPADESLQGPDGVHPSIVGQAAITRALVTRLTSTGKATGT